MCYPAKVDGSEKHSLSFGKSLEPYVYIAETFSQ